MEKNHPGFKKEAEPFFSIIMEGADSSRKCNTPGVG